MEKTCKICRQTKQASEFPMAMTTKDRLDVYCRPCKHAAQATWYIKNRAAAKVRGMLWRAKKRAKIKGLEFLITARDIGPLPKICPVLGIPLNWDRAGLPAGDSPSIDRLDNRKGYIEGNVMVISNRANMIKCDATTEEVQAVADFMRKMLRQFGI